MASLVQQQLQFPVRKSGRVSRTPSKLWDGESSPLKPGLRNRSSSQKDDTREKRRTQVTAASSSLKSPTKRKPMSAVESSPLKSPTKRKLTSVAIPPTPPKSPCKSLQSAASCPRSPSPEIYSEESDEEEADQTGLVKCGGELFPLRRLPGKNSDWLSAKLGASELLDRVLQPAPRQQLTSPSKRRVCENKPPPPTPPKSPFKSTSHNAPSFTVTADSAARIPVPTTPTKTPSLRRSLTPQKVATTPSKSPCRLAMSPQRLSSPDRLQSPERQHAHSPRKMLCRANEQLSLRSPRKTLCKENEHFTLRSPRKTLCRENEHFALRSPRKTPCNENEQLSLRSPRKTLCKENEQLSLRSPRKTPCKENEQLSLRSPRKTLCKENEHFALRSPRKTPCKENEQQFVLKSPRKPPPKLQISKPDGRCYQAAKQSLHTSKPEHLVGREEEVGEISGFLRAHLAQRSAGSLYISGAPGTGKTAALLHVIEDFKAEYNCQIAYLNCMMVKDVASVFRRLYCELSGKTAGGRTTVKDMEKLVTSCKHNMILVLDEIDQLDSKNQEVLYRIFEWPALDNSKLILVGVANALDLTDRILPRLQAKPRCRPQLLHFAPYSRNQITAIINDRLAQAGEAVVETSAVQFCARKVSAVAGDMRKALDVCRRAVELAESETKSQAVLKVADCNSPSKLRGGGVRRVGVGHISAVMAEVYGSSVAAQQSQGVPLQQKLLVCTLLLVVKQGRCKDVPLGKLHETYCKVCKRQQMAPVDQSEFHSLCSLLEARGVVGLKKAKETRLMKVTLRQDEKELEQTLQDRVLVSTILKEGLPK